MTVGPSNDALFWVLINVYIQIKTSTVKFKVFFETLKKTFDNVNLDIL